MAFYKTIENKEGPLCSTDVTASLSTIPSYVLAVVGLGADEPASRVVEALGDIKPLSVARSATLKYKRRQHVRIYTTLFLYLIAYRHFPRLNS